METELRKTGQNRYEVLIGDEVVGEVWNWHGSWSASSGDRNVHGLKSRKLAIKQIEQVYQPRY